jgi:hypothetical protein
MNEHPNVIKLRASRVADYTFKETLADNGYVALQETVSSKQYIDNGILKNYRLEAKVTERPQRIRTVHLAHLFAKHLRLSGTPLICISLAGLITELRIAQMEREIPALIPVLKTRGTGYIVVTDLLINAVSPEQIWSHKELAEVGDFLSGHIRDGGGVVFATHENDAAQVALLGPDFEKLNSAVFVTVPAQ